MTVQDLIDELMLVKDKSKEIRVVVNTNDYITSYPASLFDMSIKEGEDIAKDHFDNIITLDGIAPNTAMSLTGNGWTVDVIAHLLKGIECR